MFCLELGFNKTISHKFLCIFACVWLSYFFKSNVDLNFKVHNNIIIVSSSTATFYCYIFSLDKNADDVHYFLEEEIVKESQNKDI